MAITNLSKDNYKKEVLDTDKTILIDFWAGWCGPCKMLSPIIDEVANEVADNIKICKVNIDEQQDLATQFGIMSIPTLVVIKNGQIINNSVGVRSKEEILEMLK